MRRGKETLLQLLKVLWKLQNRGANVINLSLGGTSRSEVMKNAVDYAHENGVLIVAAVGNDGVGEVSYPAKFENVIGVSSVDANGDNLLLRIMEMELILRLLE